MSSAQALDMDAVQAACVRLITGFAYMVDQRRYEDLVGLFAHDGVFERPGAKAAGQGEIMAFMNARPATVDTRHVCAPSWFEELTDERAVVRTYVTMFHGEVDPQGGPTTIAGPAGVVEFHDVCTLGPDGWRIAHHTSRVAMITKI